MTDKFPDALMHFIDVQNDIAGDAPDGAWWAMLEEGVRNYNKHRGAHFEENDAVHAYLKWSSEHEKS